MKASRHPRPARLFAEAVHAAHPPRDAYIASIDGAARGNPGPASYAVVVCHPDGRPRDTLSRYVGRATNNVAEYYALIAALDYALAHGITKLRVRSDSELLVRQIEGRYKVKSADLRPLHEHARKLAAGLEYFSVEHVPREQNRKADALANAALDESSGTDRSFSGKPLKGEDLREEQKASRGSPGASSKPRHIRARYAQGALYPAEPLELPEGAEVEIDIRPARQH
ncbi:MAG TPA: reverse transcriptase-like protein [Candidatus Acidoferrales bacterium]|nr:reverse transcriptase-like protein [Candidatus Acidoferrales bacterium]